jgi:Flp pilus assembly protein TadD
MENETESAAPLSSIEERTHELQSNPDDPSAHARLGWAHYSAGDSDAAIEVLEEARKRFSQDIEVLYALGLALKQADNKKKAKTVFKELLAIEESSTSPAKATMFRRLAETQMEALR